MRTQANCVGPVVVLAVCLGAELACACSIPVFRYALERWPPDMYEGVLLHRGNLTDSQQKLVRKLTEAQNESHLNLRVSSIDLAEATNEQWHGLEKWVVDQPLPCLVLLYPPASPVSAPAWVGPLSEESVSQVLDSPARQALVERLIAGQSAVWVLLEIGDQAKDDAAAHFLEERLKHLAHTLELPELAPEDLEAGLLSIPREQLRIDFSLVRISRTNKAEAVLTSILLGSEDDLRELAEPMAFPVFGRGRVLYAMVGAGINEENVDEAGGFLTGACSCQVKELNPGVDILLCGDWDRVKGSFVPEQELPPLRGLAEFAETSSQAQENGGAMEAVSNAPLAVAQVERFKEDRKGGTVKGAILMVALAGFLAVGALTLILLRQRH